MEKTFIALLACFCILFSCSTTDTVVQNGTSTQNSGDSENTDDNSNQESDNQQNFKILALGDSYTIGQSVCDTCKFPVQLKDSLTNTIPDSDFSLDIIARTGWTTTNLINAINDENPSNDYDLVTLLIGVNNQYQNKPFSLYASEFPILLDKAIAFAKGDTNNVIVISIPDYAYTPFGQSTSNPSQISQELNDYNDFAESHASGRGITFINITDITREGLNNPNLVASDNLHPSELAYTKFVELLLPVSVQKLQ